jgi:hypothetical protein
MNSKRLDLGNMVWVESLSVLAETKPHGLTNLYNMVDEMKTKFKLMVLIIVITSITLLTSCGSSANNEWLRICNKIESNDVLEARAIIDDNAHRIDIKCLSKDDFIIENPKDVSPPTPYYGKIEITFIDGETIVLYNWETDYFSIFYRNRYYEIKSSELFLQLKDLHV